MRHLLTTGWRATGGNLVVPGRVTRDRPALGWVLLTVAVCAIVGVAPQAYAFEVLGVPDAPAAALRWQGIMTACWLLGGVPLARRWSLVEREGRALLGLLGVVLLLSIVTSWLAARTYRFDETYGPATIIVQLQLGTLPTHALTATMLSLVSSWTNARQLRARAADREAALRGHATRAELDALRERMQPHVVLNALNAVAALARRGETEAAAEVAADLGELLRFSLVAEEFGAFDTEREIIERYLHIEQVRLGSRLEVRWQVAPDARTVRLPALSWQPLVENAVRHDLARAAGGGLLALSAERTPTHVVLGIRTQRVAGAHANVPVDEALRSEPTPFGGLGLGVSTLERRLALAYGEAASLRREARADGHDTWLCLPVAHA